MQSVKLWPGMDIHSDRSLITLGCTSHQSAEYCGNAVKCQLNRPDPLCAWHVAAALPKFSERVLTPGRRPSSEEVLIEIASIAMPVYELLMIRHDLWKRPFPAGLGKGQYLLSACIERPLNDVHGMLEKVIAILDDPDTAIRRHGTDVFRFNMVLKIDEEAGAFEDWCIIHGFLQPHRNPGESRSRGCSLMSLAAAFLVGYWLGDD